MEEKLGKELLRGLKMMRSFACEHQAVAAGNGVIERVQGTRCTDTNSGGLCNSCWARTWAEDMEQKLLAPAP